MLVPIIELASSKTQTPAHIAALALGHISGCAVQFSQPENNWGFARSPAILEPSSAASRCSMGAKAVLLCQRSSDQSTSR